jgi:uncharacterized protein YqeY
VALKDQLSAELQEAMRAGDALRRDVLRGVLTAISNAEIARVNVKDEAARRQELGDAEVLDVLQRQAKQRRESIAEYEKAARRDLADRESAELALIEAYLPQQASRDEVEAEVRRVIGETGAVGASDKGKVMPKAIAALKGRADGRLINEVVTELLGGKA